MAKKAPAKRKPGGGRKKASPQGSGSYSIRQQIEIIEAAKRNHPDLQQKGKKWLEDMAKG